MDPQQRQMLEKLLEVAEQNNKILRGIKRQMLWSKFFTIFYWAIIIGLAIWSASLIQPYLGTLGNLNSKAQQLQDINIQDLLK